MAHSHEPEHFSFYIMNFFFQCYEALTAEAPLTWTSILAARPPATAWHYQPILMYSLLSLLYYWYNNYTLWCMIVGCGYSGV